jgi:urease accessory protein UreH
VGADVDVLEEILADHAQRCTRIGEVSWGVSALAAHGVVVRGLAHTARALQKDLWDFWSIARQALYDRSSAAPRKIY